MRLARRQGEQRIGARLGAPDPAAQLIELRQAEHVGAVHDQRVRGRDVEAGLDDRGREQHVVFAVVEGRHDVFQRGRRHLPVRDDDARFRHVLVEIGLHFGEIVDARRDVERLASAVALAQQRLAHNNRIKGRHEGAHREPVDRRRRDDREVAHAGERKLQGARDRRRAERQHMHLGAQGLDLLLVGDAEVLLLVHHQQAEVLERDGLAEQRVGADHDVDRAVGEALLHQFQLGVRDQARGLRDLHRKPAEAVGEGLVVLAREQRGRHDHGDLLAAHRRDEGGAQRHLGLAEADVAAHQAVHRLAGAEIVDHRIDDGFLILGLVIREAGAELLVHAVRDSQARRLAQLAARRRS